MCAENVELKDEALTMIAKVRLFSHEGLAERNARSEIYDKVVTIRELDHIGGTLEPFQGSKCTLG